MLTLGSIRSGLVRRVKAHLTGELEAKVNDSLLLLGRMASWRVRSLEVISSLHDAEFKVFSQWGEDGIIDWLIERANIPPHLHTFVEFGVENYKEANTRFLLQNRNWRGLVMDGNPALTEFLKRDNVFWRHDLTAKVAFVTRENINDLLVESGFLGEIGLLSVDLDGNDYWVWEAITAIRPLICICEHNAVFGDVWPVSIPYDPGFVRTPPLLYFGASIAALRSLAAKKGYRFLGTNSDAVNAFFVREDYAPRFEHALLNTVALPSRFRESRDASWQNSYVGGLERFQLISGLPVVNTETGQALPLGQLAPVYSDDWLRRFAGAGSNENLAEEDRQRSH